MIEWIPLLKLCIAVALGLAGAEAIKRPRLLLLHMIFWFWLLWELVQHLD